MSENEYNSMYIKMAHEYITKLDIMDMLTDYYGECARIPYPLLKALDHIEPHTDVRPVVFCKDCEWWKAKPNEDEEDNESNGFATWYDGNKLCHICGNGNDFCSYGKRKDNE